MQSKFIDLFKIIYMVEYAYLTIKYQSMSINRKEKKKRTERWGNFPRMTHIMDGDVRFDWLNVI